MRRPEIVKRIQETVHQAEPSATIILYGSEARGDARPDSDVDVLILDYAAHSMVQSSIQDTFLYQRNERGDQTMNETLDEQSRQALKLKY